MTIDRRQFLAIVSASALSYAFRAPTPGSGRVTKTPRHELEFDEVCAAVDTGTNYREWLLVGTDGNITAFTGRTDMGQGLRTIIIALVCQAFEVPKRKVTVVMGDTNYCPDDGPTNGSAATQQVAWSFWLASHEIKKDIVARGAKALNLSPSEVHYQAGSVVAKADNNKRVSLASLRSHHTVAFEVDRSTAPLDLPEYRDKGIKNVIGEDVVTGRLKYVGDLQPDGCLYGAFLATRYHKLITKLVSADFSKALNVEGVVKAGIVNKKPAVIGTSFEAVQRGLRAIKTKWQKPNRPRKLDYEVEVRKGRNLALVVEDFGKVEEGFAESSFIFEETYYTSHLNHCPIETDSAVVDASNETTTAWVSSQYPHEQRREIARKAKIPKENVRVIGMPVGGGYGGKISNPVSGETALLSKFAGAPVKHIYSRLDQFVIRGKAKNACILDLKTGVDAQGNMLARKYDVHQDEGFGFSDIYTVPNSQVMVYYTEMPVRHAVLRGTSYVHDVFAQESHLDELAKIIGIDPVEFRMNNISLAAHGDLMNAAADMIGYGSYVPPEDHGIGMSIINHGGRELGALFAEVGVNRSTGEIKVVRLCAAFDIGVVINMNTTVTGIRGALMWGIGFALREKVDLNGYVMKTRRLRDYQIARFVDVPDIQIKFLRSYPYNGPRGCGEMPVPLVAPAISNAVRDAVGVRLRRTPFDSKELLKALQ